MMMSLNLIQSACPTTHSLSVCLLPDEPVLCVVVGLLGAALEDVVVEVGTGAAGGARDEVGAGLLVLVPMQSPRVRPQSLLVVPLC